MDFFKYFLSKKYNFIANNGVRIKAINTVAIVKSDGPFDLTLIM